MDIKLRKYISIYTYSYVHKNNVHSYIWFQVFLSNNFQTYVFDL